MDIKETLASIQSKLIEENLKHKDFTNNIDAMISNIVAMSPKKIGTFLEDILQYHFNIEDNGNVNSENDGKKDGKNIEIKCSRVIYDNIGEHEDKYEYLINSKKTLLSIDKLLTDKKYDCNMQQVKPGYFDEIYYTILTQEGFIVFKMTSDQVLTDKNITYSDKQHRGNTGEGQFHLKKSNIEYHINTYMIDTISWKTVIEVLKKIKV